MPRQRRLHPPPIHPDFSGVGVNPNAAQTPGRGAHHRLRRIVEDDLDDASQHNDIAVREQNGLLAQALAIEKNAVAAVRILQPELAAAAEQTGVFSRYSRPGQRRIRGVAAPQAPQVPRIQMQGALAAIGQTDLQPGGCGHGPLSRRGPNAHTSSSFAANSQPPTSAGGYAGAIPRSTAASGQGSPSSM